MFGLVSRGLDNLPIITIVIWLWMHTYSPPPSLLILSTNMSFFPLLNCPTWKYSFNFCIVCFQDFINKNLKLFKAQQIIDTIWYNKICLHFLLVCRAKTYLADFWIFYYPFARSFVELALTFNIDHKVELFIMTRAQCQSRRRRRNRNEVCTTSDGHDISFR